MADALSALADGTAPDSVEYRTVVDAAADAATDVRDAARFVAGGGRGRLRLAVGTAERVGDADAAERGRRTLDALVRFRAAAAGADRDPAADAANREGTVRDAPSPSASAADSVSLRSRNGFTGRRSTTARRK